MTSFPEKYFGLYKIISAIGAGGMGEVYLAEDTWFGRDAAKMTAGHGQGR
jgi:serine/threonine protein kinase